MAARKLNIENEVVPGLALAQGPVPTSCFGGEIADETVLLDAYDAHLRLLEDRTPATVDTYLSHVKAFLRNLAITHASVALSEVTKRQVRAWLLHEANRGIAPVTRSNELFALRSFYRFLIAEGLSEENPAAAVTLPSPVRSRVEFYSDAEADAIIEWASAQPGLRWRVGRAMLFTLRYTGLRLKELVNLHIEEIDLESRRISLVGKGCKPRVVPIPHLLADVLREYLDEVRPKLPASRYCFANPNGNRNLRGRYGPRALHDLVVEVGTSAGVAGRHFAHRWRHSYATSLVRRGGDIHVVQRLMGHANIATTTRYLHLSDADLIEAIDRAFPES
jgi:integrase/recombinase XerD